MLSIERLPVLLAQLDGAVRNRLLRADQLQRWLQGRPARVEIYAGLLPELQADPAALLDLISSEVLLRRTIGEQPTCAEYVERFPALAEPLQKQFETFQSLSESLVEHLTQSILHSTALESGTVGRPSHSAGDSTALESGTVGRPCHSAGDAEATEVEQAESRTEVLPDDSTGLLPSPHNDDATTPARPAVIPRLPGRTPAIPGYEILKELGRGGMGVVYLARQLSLKRQVALKMVLTGAHADPEMLRRFRAEAEAVARLQHPNIVQIFEIGAHDGLPFFSLEYVDGGSLQELMKKGPLPPRQIAEYLETIARAIHYAHQQGIIHRDLKPANILLECRMPNADCQLEEKSSGSSSFENRKSAFGNPKITDFGLAKRQDSDSALTVSGMVMGTAAYMSPEQASGRARDIGPATDIYALGAILYELLAGQPPFSDATFQATLMKVMHDQPLPPSRLRPEVPTELEAVCLKCLAKDPAARFATAAELAEEMYRFRMGQTVLTAPLNAGFWLNLWAQRAGFQLLEPVGRSPRTEVYRARQIRLQREVALKIIRGDASDRRALLDQLEIQAVAGGAAVRQMRQVNPYSVPLVEIYDLGERDGLGYCAMEFLENGSLAQKIQGPWPLRAAVELVIKVAQALSFAHTLGFHHGNLKPSNILLTADGSPKLTDFAVSNARVDATVDIRALGKIFRLLLTGAATEETTADADTELEPLSRVRPEIPSELETICLRCLTPNARQRFDRMSDLADDLEKFLSSYREARTEGEVPTAGFPGFDLLEALGRGRIGPVYKARVSGSDRIVALQWFEPRGHVSNEQRAYFRATLEAERRLEHPYIRKIEEIGEKGRRLYVVMEYLAGGTLAERMAGKPFPPAEAAWIVEHLAEALEHAHQQGIIHGDLNPAKILLSADGVPKIGDFRLVSALARQRLLPNAGPLDVMLESRPGYKPPEYLQRRPLELTPAADIFALGATLFELLTAQAPRVAFDQQTFSREGGRGHAQKAAELASPAQLVPSTPATLDRICRRCLEWHPHKRYPTARALAGDLRRFWESLPGNRPTNQGWLRSLSRWLGS